MKARWCVVGAVSIAAVAFGFTHSRAKDPSLATISAEPATPVAAAIAQQPNAGVALPLSTAPSSQQAKRQGKTSLEIDMVEPWTGEDLAPIVVATRSGRPKFDRVDPWNPNVVHPVYPAHQLPIDDTDPWDEVVSLKKKAAPPKTQVAVERTSPWGDETTAPITSL